MRKRVLPKRPIASSPCAATGRVRAFGVVVGIAASLVVSNVASGDEPPRREVSTDTVLDPTQTYGALVITRSNVTIDGRGAWLIGSTESNPAAFKGTAIEASGVSGVTLKNIRAKGWETGLKVTNGSGWTIEGCDFSDNFHDPAFGWGENGRRGGIVLERVTGSTIRGCKANRVWDACVLVDSDHNAIRDNDFSHASDTCLKLWNASRNEVRKNNLSHGIRISPGEVHARDSTCVLIESGSNDNTFIGNDCTHGGDGIFVRVLNGWVSAGNRFEENDCSYANNNGFEAWSPRNTYVRNKANHCSYGFWLGASDQTVLIGNEASHNGLPSGHHNSPHLPDAGHAGIVFMFGPSSHTICRGNTCEGNQGAGIAVIGDLDPKNARWKAFHWILEQNALRSNRWGVYVQRADWIHAGSNRFVGNERGDLFAADGVTNLVRLPDAPDDAAPPVCRLAGPDRGRVGRRIEWDATESRDPGGRPLEFRWDLGDGTILSTERAAHVFQRPGFHRMGLTVHNGRLSDLAWRDLYITEDVAEIGTEGAAADWSWIDASSRAAFEDDRETRLVGESSVRALVSPYGGGRVSLLYPASRRAGWKPSEYRELVFWVKALNENVPAWQDVNPIVTLHSGESDAIRLAPRGDLLSQPPYNEAREGWTYFAVPLAGDAVWERTGSDCETIDYVTIGFDSWGAPPLRIWIDGLAWKKE